MVLLELSELHAVLWLSINTTSSLISDQSWPDNDSVFLQGCDQKPATPAAVSANSPNKIQRLYVVRNVLTYVLTLCFPHPSWLVKPCADLPSHFECFQVQVQSTQVTSRFGADTDLMGFSSAGCFSVSISVNNCSSFMSVMQSSRSYSFTTGNFRSAFWVNSYQQVG